MAEFETLDLDEWKKKLYYDKGLTPPTWEELKQRHDEIEAEYDKWTDKLRAVISEGMENGYVDDFKAIDDIADIMSELGYKCWDDDEEDKIMSEVTKVNIELLFDSGDWESHLDYLDYYFCKFDEDGIKVDYSWTVLTDE